MKRLARLEKELEETVLYIRRLEHEISMARQTESMLRRRRDAIAREISGHV